MHVKSSVAYGISLGAMLMVAPVVAADLTPNAAEAALNALQTSFTSDTARVQFGPRYSELYGWAAEGRAGFMLSEALALGLVVTFGENARELVLNSALAFDDNTVLMGTIAGHSQNVLNGEEREWVDQLEGGLSLRHDAGTGFIGGYEANLYATQSSTEGSLETGTTYGAEANLVLHPIPGMTARLGAGYERVLWDESDPTEGWTANLNLTQKVGDGLRLTLGADLGQTEERYSTGLEFGLPGETETRHRFGVEYAYIVDRDGGPDDQRLLAYWRMGMAGDEPTSMVSGYAGDATLTAAAAHDHDRILTAVMEKPDYLPKNVVARASGAPDCTYNGFMAGTETFVSDAVGYWDDATTYTRLLTSDPLGVGTFDLYYSSNTAYPPTGLTLLVSGATVNNGATDNLFASGVADDTANWIWAFINNGGVCTAIYWNLD